MISFFFSLGLITLCQTYFVACVIWVCVLVAQIGRVSFPSTMHQCKKRIKKVEFTITVPYLWSEET